MKNISCILIGISTFIITFLSLVVLAVAIADKTIKSDFEKNKHNKIISRTKRHFITLK